jgi:S1-C subfamily serine protease/peptidoglycan hydrolase-like protein with peptidoglycan-binding domain
MRFSRFHTAAALAATLVLTLAVLMPGAARAQQGVFIQVESHATLGETERRARAYSQIVDNVNAFRARTGLYAIALGPYAADDAQALLRDLLARGLVPRDSFVLNGAPYVNQVYPVGADALAQPARPLDGDAAQDAATPAQEAAAPPETAAPETAAPAPPEETLQQARRSEAQLDRAAREALQIALEWFGFYDAGIDAAFGPGTRAGMAAWQEDRGFEPTGVLTTRQRAQLLREYQGELAALGMETVRDERAGIEIGLPMAMVEFAGHNFPFAQFDPVDDSGVRVLLISQPGDRNTLFGLYEIMQTLEIVPLEGERERQGDSFLLTGQSETLRSHTEARLVGGAVKGFTLVWPPGRDEQMARVLPMMQQSFTALDGALDPGAVPEDAAADVDMVSGLEVRQPDRVRSGFFVDARGTVVTTTEAVAGQCGRLLINEAYPAGVSYSDDALGLAVLRPEQRLAPLAFAEMARTPGRLRADIAVAGFPFGGALTAASMAFGTLAELEGINGEETIQRLDVATEASEAGGPVLDDTGTVLGMVLPGMAAGRALPEGVTLALRADRLDSALSQAGVAPTRSDRSETLSRERLARLGADMTVTVSCWN